MSLSADQVTSLVIEFGSSAVRAGWAGEEQPKLVVPSYVGKFIEQNGNVSYRVGDSLLNSVKVSQEIIQVISGSKILDWDCLKAIWSFIINSLGLDEQSIPPLLIVLPHDMQDVNNIVDVAWSYGHPAIFIAKTAVAATFAAGRHSALVVDIGAEGTRVTPVHDGYVLAAGVQSFEIGGKLLSARCVDALKHIANGNALYITSYEIVSKEFVDLNVEPRFILKPNLEDMLKPSWKIYHQMLAMNELKETVCQVSDLPFKHSDLEKRPKVLYEFPNGFNTFIGLERYLIPEALFGGYPQPQEGDNAGIAELIKNSLSQCDVDVRATLANNIILTGGGSLIPGLFERLSYELNKSPALSKWRIHTGSIGVAGTYEKKFGAWLGGSVLASLPALQTLWVTKAEYSERGFEVFNKKCL